MQKDIVCIKVEIPLPQFTTSTLREVLKPFSAGNVVI